ncbi:hypothetical protein [Streptomyces violarus]|uniref:hypothetical protein n=1 Tax=Streptomyces violarus TaxID=67380 RepID=UPI0021BEF4F0|nr:hypothetical protein [Streptomyces violarus]MCT9142730.1 hypothetical protein [Streptomyces violarus]
MHPDIHLTLHRTRAAELRAEAGAPGPVRAGHARELRTRLGWTLVEVGLRLATRPGTAAAAH